MKMWYFSITFPIPDLTFGFVNPNDPDGPPSTVTNLGGVVAVSQYNVSGRVSSRHWDDKEAGIFCRKLGAKYGLAYQAPPNPIRSDPVFLASDFNCTGKEKSLEQCKFHDRNLLGNSSMVNAAAALCYNESGPYLYIFKILLLYLEYWTFLTVVLYLELCEMFLTGFIYLFRNQLHSC
jgi:hypothetical protein